ncbi:tripartite tricarboxylate transporter substrate-binding protein [Ancylobacter sp. MQZ15Z-1]|uniref:Tripartite tricarboxylate transporter substrate-binding protein n=1 Tax=Ancylobacter mangrovi TaxID=2972472 RepID=A0A9X2PEJ3_9HYPH|nr:tripartite tricarboxylate transporter substrate-binding protein [Ancylobacter mangrovi]MCS0497261.1 tripartite tricarboxylate transporter substrate-binding protein [Ancylobacter mangrovi]
MAGTFFKQAENGRAFAPAKGLSTLSLVAALALVPLTAARAADECAFFKDKTVELVVPFSAGGGFDAYGRMVAKYMGDELGAANMIVRNQPGAGGLLATNQTWAAKPDGLRIQLIAASGMIAAEFGGAAGVAFKTNGFSWIGRVSGEPDVIATGPDSPIKSLADIAKIGGERTVRIGSTGLGSPQYITARLLATVIETKSQVITGFSGAPEVFASLGRGDLDLFASSLSAAEAAEKAQTARTLWVFGTEREPSRPELVPLSEVVDAKFLPLITVQASVTAAGRALAAPPGIAPERLQCLRDAFDRTVASTAFLDESRQLNRPVEPLSGKRVAELIKTATEGAPKEYLDLLHESFTQ